MPGCRVSSRGSFGPVVPRIKSLAISHLLVDTNRCPCPPPSTSMEVKVLRQASASRGRTMPIIDIFLAPKFESSKGWGAPPRGYELTHRCPGPEEEEGNGIRTLYPTPKTAWRL